MELGLNLSLYAVAMVSLLAGSIWFGWRLTPRRRQPFSYAMRSGTAVAALIVLTVGTAEAGLLGFYPMAIVASLAIWLLSFIIGCLVGLGLLTAMDILGTT
jgi:threonine/homoserine efflux transporter RhtA